MGRSAIEVLLKFTFLAAGVAACAPALPTATDLPGACKNPVGQYRLTIPAGWWAHPESAAEGIEPCSYLGSGRFELTIDQNGQLAGHSVRVEVVEACLAYEFQPISSESLFVDGFPARREKFREDGFRLYWYVIELPSPPDEERCAVGRFATVRTNASFPGDYASNQRAVDAIAASLDFGF